MRSSSWKRWAPYVLAVASSAMALAIRFGLHQFSIGDYAPFVLFVVAVVVSAWFGGLGPGLLATVITYIAADFLFIRHLYPLGLSWDRVFVALIYLGQGGFISWLGHTRQAALQEVRQSHEERLRAMIDSIRDYAIYMLDPNGFVVSWNPGAQRTKGYTADEIIGQHFSRFYTPEDAKSGKPQRELDSAAAEGQSEEEAWRVRKDGSRYMAEVVLTAMRGPDGKLFGFTKVSRDITERKKAEQAVRERESMLRALFESAPDAVLVVGEDGRIDRVNAQAEAMFGYSRDEMLGRSVEDLVPAAYRNVHVQHRQAYMADARTRPMGAGLDLYAVRKDGSQFPTDIMLSPVQTSQGRLVITVVRDITERKRAEQALRALNTRLAISNRELEDFASVASHDLQEPLRKIAAFGDRLAARLGPGLRDEPLDYLQRMQNAAKRMQVLISDLLAFSRVTTRAQPFSPVDLNQIAHDVLGDLEARIAERAAQVQVDALPTIEADPTQMRQLLQNLIGNALKFARPGTPPVVHVRAEGAPANGKFQLLVTDNGIGFDEKYLDRIFNVFQRLHGRDAYEGTGIGLAVCRKIVERHGGAITARSRPGEGATFVVTLPARQPKGESV